MSDFAKYHALGNDYVVVDPNQVDVSATAEVARLLADRHFGIGADGVLIGPIGPVDPGEPVELQIFNPDGTVCEKSGNGIRMFALYLAEHYLKDDSFLIRSAAGSSAVHVLDFAAGIVSVEMGTPTFEAADIPVLDLDGPVLGRPFRLEDRQVEITCVHNGNPHTVVPLPAVSPEIAHDLGPRVARHPRFPTRTNVQFVRVVDRDTIEIEIWERGAGYTLASGSSGSAAASAVHALGLVDRNVEVRMPGGRIDIAISETGGVTLTGPVEQVAIGQFAPAFRRRLGLLPAPA